MSDYKSFLFMWCAKNKKPSPHISIREAGSNQQKRFICEMTLADYNYAAIGNSTNKKDAQLNAARDFVQYLVRSNIVPESELKQNLKNDGSEILTSTNSSVLGLNTQGNGVYRAGVGPHSLGLAYQPLDSRPPPDYSHLDKKRVDEQESVDVNASIHGNWTLNEAKNRLNQFMQMNKIKGEYKCTFIGPDNAKTFIAELIIFVPQLGRNLRGRESGSSKMAATKSCALSIIRQLFHLGVVERCSSVTGTVKRQEQVPSYPVSFSPDLLERIEQCLNSFNVDWQSKLETSSDDGITVLLAGRQGENPAEDNSAGRVISWSPPVSNWDPWRGANIDDTNPRLAAASMDFISDELKTGMSVTSVERDRILRDRSHLPIHQCKNDVLRLVRNHPVIIIKGATGCGKTTQVCQYILDSCIEENKGAGCNLVITQPRRISAISVAERVAKERSEEMGVSVGYSVRFETVLPRPYGSMLFCTVGVLLRKLELGLRGISHVIVDEIHERDVNSDFLLVILRDTLHMYPDLRVILMSATVDTEVFSNYFNNCPVLEVPGRCFDVHTYYLEDTIEMLKFTPPPVTKKKSKSDQIEDPEDDEDLLDEYDESTKNSLSQLDDKEIPFELIQEILMWCRKRSSGAVLVFLPGWSTIFSLMKNLLASHEFRKQGYIILPLHSQLPREEQRLVFEEPPSGVMKIILATNIAESSITINDVVYVIDCCKVKVKMFTSHNNMIHYATVWASRSNMEQRSGRAGRTANGYCFRLCTRSRYAKLEEHIVAEMLRTSLEELALNIKLLSLGSISHFLSKALEPPPLDAVIEAEVLLKEMQCLDVRYELTPLGRLIAKLPLEPRLARMLIIGCALELGDAASTIASNISLASEVFDIDIAMSGRQRWFAGSRYSDQIAMLNAFQRFQAMEHRGMQCQQEFTQMNELSYPALIITGEAKLQIKEILSTCSFPDESMQPMRFNFSGEDPNLDLLAALLTIGSYPNICFHKERRKVLTTESKPALIIKTSVNCSKFQTNFPSPFFVYSEKLRTKTVYCKALSMVTPVHLLLFGCNQVEVIKDIVRLDGWIHLELNAEAAAMILSLRPVFESILSKITSSPDYIYQMTEEDQEVIALIKELSAFNSGRFNLPPYSMNKNGKSGHRIQPVVQPLPAEALNIDYAFQKQLNIDSSQMRSNSSYRPGGSGPSNVYKVKSMNHSIEEQELIDDDYLDDGINIQLSNTQESIAESPSVKEKQVKVAGHKEVALDPNTSRSVLARHQQRPGTAQKNIDTRHIAKYEQDQPRSSNKMSSSQSTSNNNQSNQFDEIPSRRYPVKQYPHNYGNKEGGPGNTYHEPNVDNQYDNSYGNNSYQDLSNNYHLDSRNPRVKQMYGSANYYRQRYSQQRIPQYNQEAEFVDNSNSQGYRRGRGSYRGRRDFRY